MKKLQFKKSNKTLLNSAIKTPKKSFKVRVKSMLLSWDLKKLAINMSLFALVVGSVAGYLGYTRLYLSNERRFWMAIGNSMATSSVTRTLISGGSGNQVTQKQQFHYAPQKAIVSRVDFSQKSSTVDTSVETEGITFIDSSYSRYTKFNSNQKKSDGNDINLNQVLGKWEEAIATEEEKTTTANNFVGELVTLAVFGNYDSTFRNEMLDTFKAENTYVIKANDAVETDINGRSAIAIPVSVNLKSYATQLQKAFIKSGYGTFEPLNPENYDEGSELPASFVIDLKTNSIVGIEFGTRQETYSGYGIVKSITAPKADFKSGELEAIVQEEISTAL